MKKGFFCPLVPHRLHDILQMNHLQIRGIPLWIALHSSLQITILRSSRALRLRLIKHWITGSHRSSLLAEIPVNFLGDRHGKCMQLLTPLKKVRRHGKQLNSNILGLYHLVYHRNGCLKRMSSASVTHVLYYSSRLRCLTSKTILTTLHTCNSTRRRIVYGQT